MSELRALGLTYPGNQNKMEELQDLGSVGSGLILPLSEAVGWHDNTGMLVPTLKPFNHHTLTHIIPQIQTKEGAQNGVSTLCSRVNRDSEATIYNTSPME